MNHYPQYKVEGRTFNDGDEAERYAQHIAVLQRRDVSIMEKIDDMTPWHVVATYTKEAGR